MRRVVTLGCLCLALLAVSVCWLLPGLCAALPCRCCLALLVCRLSCRGRAAVPPVFGVGPFRRRARGLSVDPGLLRPLKVFRVRLSHVHEGIWDHNRTTRQAPYLSYYSLP